MTSIAHIINPFKADNREKHPLVYQSMLSAQKMATDSVDVQLYGTVFQEDSECMPEGFNGTTNLKRSILDVRPFSVQKKLPLIYDILDKAYEETTADYLVYTNMDIILMPQFYLVVDAYIREGHDSIIINRRDVVATENNTLNTLPKIWSAIGDPSAGYDCFVFKRSQYPSYVTDKCCIGVSAVDMGIATNLMAFAENFLFLTEEHITCHLGNDRAWMQEEFDDLTKHNYREFSKVWTVLQERLSQQYDKDHPIMKRMYYISTEEFPNYIIAQRKKDVL